MTLALLEPRYIIAERRRKRKKIAENTSFQRIGDRLALVLHIIAVVKEHDYYLGITVTNSICWI